MKDLFKELVPQNGFVIGEIACGHGGDPKKLKKLIDCVADSGCQIIKFQIFKTFERAIEGHKEWEIFDKLELSKDEWHKQIEYAKSKDLRIFADVYGYESFSLAEQMNIDGYKIHSEDLLNTEFILDVCKSKKIVIIGVGGARRKEINELINQININVPFAKIILMTGVQTFPTPLEAHSITEVSDLIQKYSKYDVKVGFSEHIDGSKKESFILPLMAFSAGAGIVEKHITFNRKDKWIDYHSALSFNDFKDFIKQTKSLCCLLNKIEQMNDSEKSYRKMFKKSPAFSNTFDEDHVLQNKDIVYVKDAKNSIPVASHSLIGKKINTSVTKNQLVKFNTLSPKIGAVIVARCSSSRLPKKALMKIDGRESIALVIDRVKRCSEVDQIILSTTNEPEDDQLVSIAEREGIEYYRGPTENVALRYLETVEAYNLEHFVRITGDSILCDAVTIDKAIISHLNSSCDVTFIKGVPFGTDKEIVSANTIRTIVETASHPENTEYLEYYLENDRNFSINYFDAGYVFNSKLRITLDYEEDLQFFSILFKHFNKFNNNFTLKEALMWLDENKDVVMVNAHMMQKTPLNLQLDVSLNI